MELGSLLTWLIQFSIFQIALDQSKPRHFNQPHTHNLPPPLAGVVHADLKLFLETNLPLSGKKKAVLGVSDAKIGAALQEEFNLSIQTGGVVAEISRGEETTFLWLFPVWEGHCFVIGRWAPVELLGLNWMWPVVMLSCDPENYDGSYWKSEQPVVVCSPAAVAF